MLLLAQLVVLVGIFAGTYLWLFVMSMTGFRVKLAAIPFDHRDKYPGSQVRVETTCLPAIALIN